jgi:hypothetical protein
MAEEKDAAELEAEKGDAEPLPPLPPIPLQIAPSDGRVRPTQRPPGQWLRENGITPPAGSFEGHAATPARRERVTVARPAAEDTTEAVRVLRPAPARRRTTTADSAVKKAAPAKKSVAKKAAKKAAAADAATKKTTVRRAGRRS